MPRHDVEQADIAVDREGLGRVPGADRVALERGARTRQLSRGGENRYRCEQNANQGVLCLRQYRSGNGGRGGRVPVRGQPRKSSAFLLSDAISPSMPLVRRIVANSDRFVANSLIVPVT